MYIEKHISYIKGGDFLFTRIQKLLHAHEVAEMPEAMVERKNVILAVTILSTIIFDILSFSIKGAQLALSFGLNGLAIAIMLVYFVRKVLQSTVQTYVDNQKVIFSSDSDAYITANISQISNTVRGKVFHTKNDYSLIMTNSEIIFDLKEYIGYIWSYLQNFPILVSNILITFIMIIGILASEFLQTGDWHQTMIFFSILLGCIILFGILFYCRIKVRKRFRDNNRILRKENEVLMNDVKNIEPLIENEFLYRVKLLIKNLQNKRKLEKKEYFSLNILHLLRTVVLGIFMIIIIIIKLTLAGGLENLSLSILTDIIAVSTVYSGILDKVASILTDLESIKNTIEDIKRIEPDVNNILSVYEEEKSVEFSKDELIEEINIEPFEFSYPGAMSVYKLRNSNLFKLIPGNSYLVYGHTGCGKSTFMHLLIGKIKMALSPISYGGNQSQKAYLASIMHESNGRLGSNPILQELLFSSDVSHFDCEKLINILHGTNIYEDIMRNLGLTINNDSKVLEYLNSTTIEQYSSGQKQRLAIVKVLYNLSSHHRIVVFDEATNALDDNTTISVLKFMADFCQKDMNRIVLFVSHQVELTKKITNGNITFLPHKAYDSEGNYTILPGAFDIVAEV